ncbi:uncharacterized protein LOC129926264 isoform X2 [Biomphalaria glabrata]|uniref:Uncharacterized protein LOC129926264 isoform X2 n=1 Tax=Biomphalaria glabrata TaxID=6526 RepID=A0A9W3ACT7_BIOGL|nr:uncharacterized protein LOC129926264 isoform X2 [Biomphalaria glabrata]XP_055885086.1 uncharacterized protein LOC129926264 isoform X2 [Biomphalaria glabrata]XP_055885087.1 uncharacterized protein LOC129926264 isoform X2 [Biomphalaria glabrata]KAI8749545.1 hypothetical protein BgiMline_016495 [Biomphalaria glabrata]
MACGCGNEPILVPIHAFHDEETDVLVQIVIEHLKRKSKHAAKNADIKVDYKLRGFLLTADVQLPNKQIKKYRLAYTEKLPEIDTEKCYHKIKDGAIKMFIRKKGQAEDWDKFIRETKVRALADSNDEGSH